MKIWKLLILLILIISSECHLVSHKTSKRLAVTSARKAFASSGANPQDVIASLKNGFKKIFNKAKESKLFNFLFGATIKILNTINSNELVEIGNCVVNSAEMYFVSAKFTLKELNSKKNEPKSIDAGNIASNENKLSQVEKQEDDSKNEIGDDKLAQAELVAIQTECAGRSAILEESEGAKEKIVLIEGEDEIENMLNGGEENKNSESFLEFYSERKGNPKILKRAKTLLKEFGKEKLENLKKFKNKVKEKIQKAMDKISKKFNIISEKIKEFLNKPLVKTLIFFFECAIPSLLGLVFEKNFDIVSMFADFDVFQLVLKAPKFAKMFVDAFKSLRSGFKETKLQAKYIHYGKGTATIIMLIIFSILGNQK